MIDFSDPNWLDVLIGATALIVSTALAVYFFMRARSTKKLSYEIITSEPLLTVNEAHTGDIQILFKGQEVQDAHIIVIKLINDGNTSIAEEDLNVAVTFSFGQNTNILSYEITDKDPASLPASLFSAHPGNEIVLNRLLLNASDFITIKFLLTNFRSRQVNVTGRIVGVKEITKFKPPMPRPLKIFIICLMLFGVTSVVYEFFSPGSQTTVLISFSTLVIIILAMIVFGVIAASSTLTPNNTKSPSIKDLFGL